MTRAISTELVDNPAPQGSKHSSHPETANDRYADVLSNGCTLVAFLLPIKLSLTYIALAPLIVLWAYANRSSFFTVKLTPTAQSLAAPLAAFIAVVILSCGFGVSPTHSLPALTSLIFFALTVPLFANHAHPKQVCLALITGQSLAAFHSFLDAALPNTIPGLFLGKVTESGQLAIAIPLVLGILIGERLGIRDAAHPKTTEDRMAPLVAVIITASLTLLAFQHDLALQTSKIILSALVLITCSLIVGKKLRAAPRAMRYNQALLLIGVPLLTTALLVNLKRGPWLGVLVGTACLLVVYARRLIIPVTLGASLLAVSIAPMRDRILASYDHFTIEGGRSTIWRIGAELIAEYPLGIGYHNSGILREFAPEIPPELKHFHNNFLNIAAETGWLGIAVFAWLVVAILKGCFRDRQSPLYVAIGSAVISWQVAGLVEYNFGDSEVTIVVWVLLGLLLQRDLYPALCSRDRALHKSEL